MVATLIHISLDVLSKLAHKVFKPILVRLRFCSFLSTHQHSGQSEEILASHHRLKRLDMMSLYVWKGKSHSVINSGDNLWYLEITRSKQYHACKNSTWIHCWRWRGMNHGIQNYGIVCISGYCYFFMNIDSKNIEPLQRYLPWKVWWLIKGIANDMLGSEIWIKKTHKCITHKQLWHSIWTWKTTEHSNTKCLVPPPTSSWITTFK